MRNLPILHYVLFLLLLVTAGCQPLVRPTAANVPIPTADHFATATPGPAAALAPTPTPVDLDSPVNVAVDPAVPERYAAPMLAILRQNDEILAGNGPQPLRVSADAGVANAVITMGALRDAAYPLLERYYAAVMPFATIQDQTELAAIAARWQNVENGPLFVTPDAATFLPTVLGERDPRVPVVDAREMQNRLESTPGALGLLPFDRLHPELKVLAVDGLNILDNQLDPAAYPLAAALHVTGNGAPLLRQELLPLVEAISPRTNRAADQMTTLIMTGVTAMSRATAAVMERTSYIYPAAIISGTLAAADITHVSNEVPFLDDCVVNNTVNNLILCSHTDYWQALEAIGTDIVGLSGNHVNDFGREGARRSLQWYRDNQIPIYGSGMNVEEACAPLLWEHNGNRFAFVAALAFGPSGAWATDELPGACYYYDHKESVLELVAELAQEVDVVAVELQYVETYNPFPTGQQVVEFRELRDAGAHIVTGVQSHVPQAMEPYGSDAPGGPGMISYGLGNLFFDQMWSWETRTELMARHTIYQGRVLNTEILTAVLENYAQPRWTTDTERAEILGRIFNAAPPRP